MAVLVGCWVPCMGWICGILQLLSVTKNVPLGLPTQRQSCFHVLIAIAFIHLPLFLSFRRPVRVLHLSMMQNLLGKSQAGTVLKMEHTQNNELGNYDRGGCSFGGEIRQDMMHMWVGNAEMRFGEAEEDCARIVKACYGQANVPGRYLEMICALQVDQQIIPSYHILKSHQKIITTISHSIIIILYPSKQFYFDFPHIISNPMEPIFSEEEIRFNRLNLDYVKKNDLRVVFQILMSEPEKRTVADINTLARIFLNVEPVKRIKNFSTIYHICRSMFLAKFREKAFVYQKQEEAECLYLVLNGKVGLYKRQPDIDDQEDVIFLSQGNCFGSAYNWKQKFLPLTFEETLVAIVPRREVTKLTVRVLQEREEMLKTLKKARLFEDTVTEEALRSASQFFTLHRLPFGTFLIKEGEIPKAIYYLLKGTVKKQLQMSQKEKSEYNGEHELVVATYSSGDYFPKESLSDCLTFNIIAESPCEVISIPKKALKLLGWTPKLCESQWKTQEYYRQQMRHQEEWRNFKDQVVTSTLNSAQNRPRPLRF